MNALVTCFHLKYSYLASYATEVVGLETEAASGIWKYAKQAVYEDESICIFCTGFGASLLPNPFEGAAKLSCIFTFS